MEISANTINRLYAEAWGRLKVDHVLEDSRNGPVMVAPEPVLIKLYDPLSRVLTNEARDCNPFFHIAEVVWILSGINDVRPLAPFNRRYHDYANNNIVLGAYGHRWQNHFAVDQISGVIDKLRTDPETRQAVLQMWDPNCDLYDTGQRDRPCNIAVTFRTRLDELDMTVHNRSNDLVWGALGANVVHFTYIQEMIATAAGLNVGRYYVMTNNLHVYTEMPRFAEISKGAEVVPSSVQCDVPILEPGEDNQTLRNECLGMLMDINEGGKNFETENTSSWLWRVAEPAMRAYLVGPGTERLEHIARVEDTAWRKAMYEWVGRREK